jgi:hypothetical protein
MRIPNGDLVPARRHPYGGGYSRRRARRTRRFAVLGVLLVAVGIGGFWLNRDPVSPVATPCPSASPTPSRLMPEPGQVRVVLLNGASRLNLAKVVGAQLRQRGFVVVREDNAPAALAGPSVVTYAAGAQDAAAVLGHHVLGARVSSTGPAPVGAVPANTVQLVLGGDFVRLATPAEAAAAAQAPAVGASPSARPCP